MSVLAGFGDLKPKDILVWNANGTVLIRMGDKVELFQLQLQPTGCISARPIEKDQPPDQAQRDGVDYAEQRLAMTDQGAQLLGG